MINQEDKYDILVEALVNEVYIETYYKQYFRNSGFAPAELCLSLALLEEIQFVDFEVEKGDKKINLNLIIKQNGEGEKYTDSLASGNTGVYIEYDNNSNQYFIKIGNIEPGKTIFLKYHFIQNLESDDFNYIYKLLEDFPKFYSFNNTILPKSVKAKIKFETFYPITKLEPIISQQNLKIIYNYNDNKGITAEIIIKDVSYLRHLISFKFKTKDYEKPKLFSQYDSINDETSFFLRNVEKEENKKPSPGYYYFLFNEMDNLNVNELKEFLKIFIPLLPEESYYQIIGIGRYVKFYNIKILKYSPINYQKIINNINNENKPDDNNNLQNIINYDEVIEHIYNSEKNNNMPKFIFILSNFGLFGTKINLKEKYEKDINKFKLFRINFRPSFIDIFSLQENEIKTEQNFEDEEKLKEIIKNQLKCMNNYYTDVKYDILNDNSNEVLYDFKNDNYLIENKIKNYYFIKKGKINGNIDINNSFKLNNNDYKNKLSFNDNNIVKINEGNILAKIIINNIIKNNQISNDNKVKILSKKYQISGRYTSIFCEIKNQEDIHEGTIRLKENNHINNRNNFSLFNLNNQAGPLFGNTNANNNQINGLFGNNTNNNNNQTGGLFGNNTNNNNQTSGLFANNTNNNNQQTSGLFANNINTNNNQQTSGLFGNINTNNQQTGGLFGNTNNNNQTGGLFGNNTNTNNNQHYDPTLNTQRRSLFGNNNNTYQTTSYNPFNKNTYN